MSNFFNGLSILRTVGTGDGGFMQLTPRELETERDWMASEEDWLKEREGLLKNKAAVQEAHQEEPVERRQDGWAFGKERPVTGGDGGDSPELRAYARDEVMERQKALEAWRKHRAEGEGEVFETADGERFVPNTQLKAFHDEMAAKSETPRRVRYFRTRGMMDESGKTITDAPVTLKWVEGDPKMDYVMEWFRQNPEAQGRMLPEMYRFLGITAEQVQREANEENVRRQEQQEMRHGTLRNQGQIGAAELSGMSVGFGGMSLKEQNKGKGGATQTWNYFNARLNPVASTLDEYGQGTELELASPDGYETLKKRQAEGRPLLTKWEKVTLGLWGDTSALDTPEAVQDYIRQRLEARQSASEAEAVRGTTLGADILRATEDSARMGAEFALVNAVSDMEKNADRTIRTAMTAM